MITSSDNQQAWVQPTTKLVSNKVHAQTNVDDTGWPNEPWYVPAVLPADDASMMLCVDVYNIRHSIKHTTCQH